MTLDQVRSSASRMDRRRVAANTEATIRQHMIEDGEDPDMAPRPEDVVSPAVIRRSLKMSQSAFAAAIGIPVATLRNWEQNRVAMDASTMALMRILAREPRAALRALRRKVSS